MTAPALFGLAMPSNEIGDWVLRILAIAGGGAIGGLLVGWLTQVGTRMLTTRPMPRGPLNIVRLLAAIAAGWLVAMLLHPGLGGFGGGGGKGDEEGSGKSGGQEQPRATDRDTAATNRNDTPRDTTKSPPTDGWTLQIIVTESNPVEYEVHYRDGKRTYPFKEIGQLEHDVGELTTKQPPLIHVQIVSGSDPNASGVKQLREWVEKNHLN